MARKVMLFILILTLPFAVGLLTPAFAAEKPVWINCSVSQLDSKVTIEWGGIPTIREIKIIRDGSVFKDFTNVPSNGSYSVVETLKDSHRYKAIAYKPDGGQLESKEYRVTGTGEPKIKLEFINNYKGQDEKSVERVYNWVKIENLGSTDLDLSQMIIRYFFTIDGEPKAAKDDPNNGQEKVEASDQRINPNYEYNDGQNRDILLLSQSIYMMFTRVSEPVETKVDYFCETYFTNTKCKINSGYNLKIQPAFHKQKLENNETDAGGVNYIRNYDLTNDYSYNNSDNIAVYYENKLIWGNDPTVIAPKNLSAKLSDFTNVKLKWDASAGADSYTVLRSESGDGTFSPVISGIKGTSYNDKIPMPSGNDGKSYYYKVVANYGKIVSKDSNVASVTAYKFFAPTSLKAELKNYTDVNLTWNASSGATGYNILKSERKDDGYIQIPEAENVRTLIYTDKIPMYSGNSGKTYYYKVVAVSGTTQSVPSDDANVSEQKLNAPRSLTAKLVVKNVRLNWAESPGAITYTIKRSSTETGTYVPIKSGVTGTTWTDETINVGVAAQNYYYKVVAVNSTVTSADSNYAGITMKPYWNVNCNIINKAAVNNKNSSDPDFVLGSYIPVSFTIEFKNETVDPMIMLSDELGNTDTLLGNKLNAELVSKSDQTATKLLMEKLNNSPVQNSVRTDVIKDSDDNIFHILSFKGKYAEGDVINVEFVLRVKADESVLSEGISHYYGKNYDLNFIIKGNQGAVTRAASESISIKIVKPDKLK